ncbi:MAG: hypothetical protein IPG70_16420 [Moraxellaceae bacterium]|nr:hypothetical protein [Moraxellaceae bacterium]
MLCASNGRFARRDVASQVGQTLYDKVGAIRVLSDKPCEGDPQANQQLNQVATLNDDELTVTRVRIF